MHARVVLEGLELPLSLGAYAPGDVVPNAHLLDLTLNIDPALVLVPGDAMKHVFDYDPLIAQIEQLARDGHYETQEWLMTRIATACAREKPVHSVAIKLSKRPVLRDANGAGSGTLGVSVALDRAQLDSLLDLSPLGR
ncbi:MAG: dihydroneopterin aldolase [Pseudomonadota bacterium]